MLFDTDVLIWATRGHAGAPATLADTAPMRMSVVSYMELAQACRNKLELKKLKKSLQLCRAILEPLDEASSQLAAQLIDRYAHSHNLRMADALIAATAITQSLTLLTANDKHFAKIEGLKIRVFRP